MTMRTLFALFLIAGASAAADPPMRPRRVAFAPDGQTLAIAGSLDKGGVVLLRDPATGRDRWSIAQAIAPGALAWAPDGTALYVASGDSVLVLDPSSGKEVRRFGPHGKGVWSLSLSADGKTLATGGADRTIRLWDTAGGKEKQAL